jgi:translation initiation factor 2 subunit 2
MSIFFLPLQLAPFDPTYKKKTKKIVIQKPSDEVDRLGEKTNTGSRRTQ